MTTPTTLHTHTLHNGNIVTLTTDAGDVALTVPARAFTGAQESYVPTPSASMSH